MRTKKPGFTLIELMVVVCLLGLVMLLTITNLSFLNSSMLRAEVEKLYAACMYAQRTAMVTNEEQTLKFDPGTKSYSINDRKEQLPKNIDFGFLPGSKGPPSSPQHLIKSPITFQQQNITFNSRGIIKPGTVYLIDSNHHHMTALSSPISQVSFLRKYRYDKKWKLIT